MTVARSDATGRGELDPDVLEFTTSLPVGPRVPSALKEQLAIGGRLVIPVGQTESNQTLLKITRKSATKYEEQDLGPVAFVR